MSRLILRPATTAAEHARLAQLAREIWHEHYPGIIGVDQIEYMLEHGYSASALDAQQTAGTRFLLAWRAEAPIGLSALTPDQDRTAVAWLDKLYVLDSARGGGVARQLVERACDDARKGGARELRLRVNRQNANAIAAYERMAFGVTHAHVKAIGGGFVMDDYVMARPLTSAPAS